MDNNNKNCHNCQLGQLKMMTRHNNFDAHQNVTGRQMMGRRMTMSPKCERACRGFNCSPLLCRESNLGSSSLLAPGSRTGRQGFVFAPHTHIWSPDSGQWTHTHTGRGQELVRKWKVVWWCWKKTPTGQIHHFKILIIFRPSWTQTGQDTRKS